MDKAIVFENVGFSYDEKKQIINGLSFSISKGEKVAVIGPNGAGKSTLISLLNGVRRAQGKIIINGLEIAKENLVNIKSSVGIVFQSPEEQLFCPTVFDDVAFGPLNQRKSLNEIKGLVEKALADVGLEGKEGSLINELSFGEKKLVSLATVLSMNPSLLVFDEPSANLDPYHRRLLIKWIKNENDKSIVIATHDLDLALETCERVMLLAEGKLISDGHAETILTDEKLLVSYNLELPLSLQSNRNKGPKT